MRLDRVCGWFRAWLAEEGMKAATIRCKSSYIQSFVEYLSLRRVCDTRAITRQLLSEYCRHLQSAVSERTGRPYRALTIRGRISAARVLLLALYDAGIMAQPVLPPSVFHRQEKPLETLLGEADVAVLLESIRADSSIGLRDRALFELIYGSALRAGEVGRLKWEDVNLSARRAVVRQGKFDKDRVVPLTHETVEMLSRYQKQQEIRGSWVFPGHNAQGLSPGYINKRFKMLCTRAGLYQAGMSTHQLRHACATHLVARGANIRYVQTLLGHESVQTTVRYTRQMSDEVQKSYRRYHPRENQLCEILGSAYEQRLAALEQHLLASRNKRLAKTR